MRYPSILAVVLLGLLLDISGAFELQNWEWWMFLPVGGAVLLIGIFIPTVINMNKSK